MTSSIVVTPKKHFLEWKHVLWAIKRENRSSRLTWAHDREKKGQDRTGQSNKKVTKALYFTYLGRSPNWTDFHKNLHGSCRHRHNHVCKLLNWNIFRGYDFTWGRISRFILILAWSLQQCSATVLPVIAIGTSAPLAEWIPYCNNCFHVIQRHDEMTTNSVSNLNHDVDCLLLGVAIVTVATVGLAICLVIIFIGIGCARRSDDSRFVRLVWRGRHVFVLYFGNEFQSFDRMLRYARTAKTMHLPIGITDFRCRWSNVGQETVAEVDMTYKNLFEN